MFYLPPQKNRLQFPQKKQNRFKNPRIYQMALSSGALSGIYTGLIVGALVISVLLMLTLSLYPMACIGILGLYMCGCSAYILAYLIINKKTLNPADGLDVKYMVADYMCLFNAILCLFIFIMSIVIASRRNDMFRLGMGMGYRPPIL
jgi:hypothetical protein